MAQAKVAGFIKLQIKAGEANPAPPIGPALGQHGVNIMDFCNAFNEASKEMERGLLLPVVITVNADRSFSFIIKQPPAAVLLRRAIGIDKGSGTPNKDKVGKISRAQLEEVAKMKMDDLNAVDLEGAVRILAGTARSSGIEVEGME